MAAGGNEAAAIQALEARKAKKQKVPGLGHPQHSSGDPRADKLLEAADLLGISGAHIAARRHLGQHAPGIMNRPLPINVSGAIPAVILDAGWPLAALKAVPLLARTAGLAAHLYAGTRRLICFTLSQHADLAIQDDGEPAKRGRSNPSASSRWGPTPPGPAAAMHPGADVIKIERPGEGDPFRAFKGGLYLPIFQTCNRNKRPIALDPNRPEDLATFRDLIASANVFIQNFRPGVAEKMGAGWDDLRALNPRLIYCAISSFGTSGPARDRPTYDTVAQAAAGFPRLVRPPTNPRVIGPALADAVTAHYAATGILAALLERGQTGKGQRLDISMLEATCHFNLDSFTHFYSGCEVMGPLSRSVVSQTHTFECADGTCVAIHIFSPPKFWTGFIEATGQEQLATAPRFAERLERIRHQDDLIAIMTPASCTKPCDVWCAALEAAKVPYSPADDADEALEAPQARHPGIKVSTEGGPMGSFTFVRPPYTFDGAADRTVLPPPTSRPRNRWAASSWPASARASCCRPSSRSPSSFWPASAPPTLGQTLHRAVPIVALMGLVLGGFLNPTEAEAAGPLIIAILRRSLGQGRLWRILVETGQITSRSCSWSWPPRTSAGCSPCPACPPPWAQRCSPGRSVPGASW